MLGNLLESNYVVLGIIRTKEQVFRLCGGAIESQAVASPPHIHGLSGSHPVFSLGQEIEQPHSFSLGSEQLGHSMEASASSTGCLLQVSKRTAPPECGWSQLSLGWVLKH